MMDHDPRELTPGDEPDGPTPGRPGAGPLGALVGDPHFRSVVLIWALCCLGQATFIDAYGISLPWCDELYLTDVASGREPLSWEWLWRPANEHRAPLTRLAMYVLGRLGSWDWQVMHYAGLESLSAGSMALILAARSLRGRSALSDAFLCLVVLNPWHFETIVTYGYAYALASGLLCVTIGLAATRWPIRSTPNLLLYLVMALVVSGSAGPPGNFWAMGLCGIVLVGMLGRASVAWKACGLAGTSAVAAVSFFMLLQTPYCPLHEPYRSQSIGEALAAGAKMSVGWLGHPPLMLLWPWAVLAVLVPGLVVVMRLVRDVASLAGRERGRAAALTSWWGLGLFLVSALMVAGALGYGRGRYPEPWTPRYLALTQPIGICLYLLMVQLRVSPAIPQNLALGMAVCFGWCWPESIGRVKWHSAPRMEFVKVLRDGKEPLSVAAGRYIQSGVGLKPADMQDLTGWLLHMRQADLSVFHNRKRVFHGKPVPLPMAWEAETGILDGGLHPVIDALAVSHGAVDIDAESKEPATARYVIRVPAAGSYKLWCRLRTGNAPRTMSVRVDDGSPLTCVLPGSSDYYPYAVESPFELGAGRHTLTISQIQPGTRLDLLELIPRPNAETRTR